MSQGVGPGSRDANRSTPRTGSHRLLAAALHRPPDALRDASRRLAIVSLIIAGISILITVIYTVIPLLGEPQIKLPVAVLHGMVMILVVGSVLVFFLARSRRLTPQQKLDVGLLYEIFIALLIGGAVVVVPGPLIIPKYGLSEVCVLILIFPVIVPNTPIKTLIAAFIVACTTPLGTWVAGLTGKRMASPSEFVEAYYWNYICAALALLPSFLLTRLSRELSKAREMGSYRLTKLLGRGGMGEVWRAKHRLLVREAAIKLIQPEVLQTGSQEAERILNRFEREVQATAALDSPHTVQIFDYGISEDGTFYYVMELLPGLDLRTLVQRFGPIPSERAAFLLAQVCHSLADAHARGMIHRDIKPANLFTCRKGLDLDYVKVLDFGLVKHGRDGSSEDLTLTQGDALHGTPAFMAPEMIRGEAVDARADLYSLGCVAYWLLTGKLVFEGKSTMDVLIQHVEKTPVRPSSRCELPIPEELEQLVLHCLEKNPLDRPESARELRSSLLAFRFQNPWTEDRARRWWRDHLPG